MCQKRSSLPQLHLRPYRKSVPRVIKNRLVDLSIYVLRTGRFSGLFRPVA